MKKRKPISEYHEIFFEPPGISARAEHGAGLRAISDQWNIPIRYECGGKGICGKCRVMADSSENLSPPTEIERETLEPDRISQGCRLACQVRVLGDVYVTIPEQSTDSREAVGKDEISGTYEIDPAVRRIFLPKARMTGTDGANPGSLSDWLARRVESAGGHEIRIDSPDILRRMSQPGILEGDLTLVFHEEKGVTAILPGRRGGSLGVAVDIGTTTVAAYVCNLETGEVMTAVSSVNPQRRHGEDVISRIARANERKAGLGILRTLIIWAVNDLIAGCVEKTGISPEDIDEMTIVGNTTMQQIFAGFHPGCIGVAPYLPATLDFPVLDAGHLKLKLNPGTPLYLFPVISGFVGGDTLGAVLAEASRDREQTCLIVDIGTNGELVLRNRDELWATSCATGPALEGAQISCGMRAASGAIHKVEAGSEGKIRYFVLGNEGTLPLGICGSGIIDAAAVLRKTGILLPSGRFDESRPEVICDEKGIGRKFVLVPREKSESGTEISITLKDIRQLQLAKAALAVGINYLMRKAGVKRIHRTVLTGAFGARFDWRNAAAIGMLPPEAVAGDVEAMDNLAGVGAIKALLDKKERARLDEIRKRIRFIELAGEPDFAMEFARATFFPDYG